MDTVLLQKFPFILDRNLAKANCTENQVCTSCDTAVLGPPFYTIYSKIFHLLSNLLTEKLFAELCLSFFSYFVSEEFDTFL